MFILSMIWMLGQEILLIISNMSCLFGAANKVKNSDKEKQVYSGYGITFSSAGLWSFGDDFAENIVIFGVDNSSSIHA